MKDVSEVDPIPVLSRADGGAHSGDIVAGNIEALKALFPSVVADGNIDFDVLRQLLGSHVDDGEELYGLSWKGKRRARAFGLTPSLGTVHPSIQDSVNWENTQNIIIEGDNLDVLKLLRKSYAGRVKLIYIDPPYNTGSDFVYPDDYSDTIGNYERLTGQRDAEGVRLTSNKEASGRFHTDWLNMMYPRLIVAKELLTDDGVIAVSIGDGELPNLVHMMRDIFGEENVVATLVWKSRQNKDNRTETGVSVDHEYIVTFGGRFRGEARDVAAYSNPDNDDRGPWTSANMVGLATPDRRPNLHYDLINPASGINYGCPPLGWRYDKNTMGRLIGEGRILWPTSPDGRPRRKSFLSDLVSEFTGFSSIVGERVFTRHGTADIAELFEKRIFDFPKPVALISQLIEQTTANDSIVLDFFGGSGTTGDAVLRVNAKDDGCRRYILIQLPEPLDPRDRDQKTAADFCDELGKPRNIAELMKERLRRAGTKVEKDYPDAAVDTGFRVYKLAASNLKPWLPDPDSLEGSLLESVDNVLPGRTEDDLLVELLLKTGIDLTLPSEQQTIAGKTVHSLGGGVLIVCLADIGEADAEAIGQGICDWRQELDPPRPTTFYFRDSGFENAATKANLAAIIKQRLGKEGVEKLASI
jgi:adenine-specific DNA-methyltransferase